MNAKVTTFERGDSNVVSAVVRSKCLAYDFRVAYTVQHNSAFVEKLHRRRYARVFLRLT